VEDPARGARTSADHPRAVADERDVRQLGLRIAQRQNLAAGGRPRVDAHDLRPLEARHPDAVVVGLDPATRIVPAGGTDPHELLRLAAAAETGSEHPLGEAILVQARERGLGVIFITHNPHHAYPVGDRFMLLRRGRSLGDFPKAEMPLDELVRMMAGGAELDALSHELERSMPDSDVTKEMRAEVSGA